MELSHKNSKLDYNGMSAEDVFASIDQIKTGMAIYDEDLNLIFANKTIRLFLPTLYACLDEGQTMMESILAQAKVIAPGKDDVDYENRARYIYNTIKTSGTLEVTTPTGQKLNSSYNKTSSGKYIVTTTDVTARIKNEERLLEARHKANRANAAKTEFLANMSHEIRTPLSGVSMAAHLLQRQLCMMNVPELNDLANILVDSAGHLSEIINDVLDLSKIEAGQVDIVVSDNSLSEMLQTLVKSQKVVADEKSIDLDLVVEKNFPERLLYDPVRVRQCVTNLVSNALKFTASGRVTVAALVDPKNGSVTIHVVDTGIGISTSEQAQIFDQFAQVKYQDSQAQMGTGLGLAISRKLARLMGGDITLTSELNKGSIFTLTFPCQLTASTPKILASAA